jgi:zinc protease
VIPARAAGAIVALVLSAAAATAAAGQDIDRSTRPAIAPPPTFKFPKLETHTLPNGLRLIVVEDHALPLVSARIVLGVDSTADPLGKEGLYAVTLGALREGTTSMTAEQLADAFADVGATVAPTGFTATTQEFARGLALAGEMLMHPLLDQAAIDRRKATQSASARRLAQTPVTGPRHLFYAELYGADDPYVRSLVPTEASIAGITRDDVAHFYDQHIGPKATTIVLAGDVHTAAALADVRRVFGRWQTRSAVDPSTSARSATQRPTTIYLRDVPGTQAYLYVGNAGPARTSSDFYAVETAAAVSGIRMQQSLRDKRSFMYSGNAGMIWRPVPAPSAYVGSTSVNAGKVDSALVEWLSLLRGLRGDRVATAQELDAVRRNRIGALPARIDGPDSLAARVVDMVRDRLSFDYFDQYATRMASVAPADVASAATKYIDLEHLIIVVTGDRAAIEPALRAANIAPIVIVDANGKPIDR